MRRERVGSARDRVLDELFESVIAPRVVVVGGTFEATASA